MPTPRRYADNAERQSAYRARGRAQRDKELSSKGLPRLPAVGTIPGHQRWDAMIGQVIVLLESITVEMKAYWADRSEGWQESERGEGFAERMEQIEEILTLMLELQ